MSKIIGTLIGLVLLATVIAVNSAAYTVEPRQQVIVLQFGEVKHVETEPGLHWKTPFIQDLKTLEAKRRLIELDIKPVELITKEKKRLIVDAFARYRIENPVVFYTNLRSIESAKVRLSGWLATAMRTVVAQTHFEDVVKEDRVGTMDLIEAEFKKAAEKNGISVEDVKFKRADLPEKNARAVFARMETEREREAKKLRAEGEEQANNIKTDANNEVTVIKAKAEEKRLEILSKARVEVNTITSEATREARVTRGKAEAEQIKILADAYEQDPEFFEIYRAFETYRSFEGQNFVLSTDVSFLDSLLRPDEQGDGSPTFAVSQ